MPIKHEGYDFYSKIGRIINSGQSRSIIITGNVYDLFWDETDYVPLIPFLLKKTANACTIQLVYELNGPIRASEADKNKLRESFVEWKAKIANYNWRKELDTKGPGVLTNLRDEFNKHWTNCIANPSLAVEFMRQLCIASRDNLKESLTFFIEGADMIVPAGTGDIAALNDHQLRRISVMQDWFSDPAFVSGKDTVCLVAESASLIHPRVARMPQTLVVEAASPNTVQRQHYIEHFIATNKWPLNGCTIVKDDADANRVAVMTGGLSIYALRQLLVEAKYIGEPVSAEAIVDKVEDFIQSQLGEDVVEFTRPHHKLDAVIGATQVVNFIKKELIPRIKARDKTAISGCIVSGSIGGGKTFIFEAVSAELDMPVMVLKNLRSQWFGQTDVIFERLRRVIVALDKLNIFLDEADVQFGGLGGQTHETEKRLTGKVQAMMSDPRLKGKVFWTLMTARVWRLSPDIRRQGRPGDIIIPILDAEGEDRMAFIGWTLGDLNLAIPDSEENKAKYGDARSMAEYLNKTLPDNYSAASFAGLKSHLATHRTEGMSRSQIIEVIEDLIPADIELTREYQKLQALMNCTRRSLLPASEIKGDLKAARSRWQQRIKELKAIIPPEDS